MSCIVTSEAHLGQIIQNSSEYKDNVIGKLERLANQEIIAENTQSYFNICAVHIFKLARI